MTIKRIKSIEQWIDKVKDQIKMWINNPINNK